MNAILGIHVGGANLKYATLGGQAHHRRFALWRSPQRLADTLVADLQGHTRDAAQAWAVTMTGELADCFADRAAGVQQIVAQVTQAARRLGVARDPLFYGVDGRFHTAADAAEAPDRVAAANWHALASFVARHMTARALLVDVGSTTTDVIPITEGKVATSAATDHDRLKNGSLVYIGCRRTPVASLVDHLHFRGGDVPVINEVFATIDDARLLVGSEAEDASDCDTADHRPRTRRCAAGRVARMIGLDQRTVGLDEAAELAGQVVAAARRPIAAAIGAGRSAIESATEPARDPVPLVLSGHGADLVLSRGTDDLAGPPGGDNVVDLAGRLGAPIARCAPSYAVARLLESSSP